MVQTSLSPFQKQVSLSSVNINSVINFACGCSNISRLHFPLSCFRKNLHDITMEQPTALSRSEKHGGKSTEETSPNRNRWGMFPKAAAQSFERMPVNVSDLVGSRDNLEMNAQWNDFDHSETVTLTLPAINPSKGTGSFQDSASTNIMYQKDTDDYFVVRSCLLKHYTMARKQLVETSRSSQNRSFFIPSKCVFKHNDSLYVGSELSDMSLASIIDCEIALQERHIKAILVQVISPKIYSLGD